MVPAAATSKLLLVCETEGCSAPQRPCLPVCAVHACRPWCSGGNNGRRETENPCENRVVLNPVKNTRAWLKIPARTPSSATLNRASSSAGHCPETDGQPAERIFPPPSPGHCLREKRSTAQRGQPLRESHRENSTAPSSFALSTLVQAELCPPAA